MDEKASMEREILLRLRTIKGHIGGIEKMVEEGKTCPEILMQVAAIRSSIEKLGVYILENYAQTCLMDTLKEGEDVIVTFKDVVDQIIRFMK
ncbi:MAG: CsoR family transcriptional regulator, copper-sensing transcriptional repressor [Thermosediminibacterales bacterium]|nr:CsoR family transcriptional regulator, copper-sensing transcriptional repressor [Thermosediminibacterales bacterium]MDK2835913.1 CsoR family transcriptional regulator, copper-sensing transcriptional repressor [Thermosediminibacterales bacterium]